MAVDKHQKELKESATKEHTINWEFSDNKIYTTTDDIEYHETWSNLKSIKKFSDGYLIKFNSFINFLSITAFSNNDHLEFEKLAGNKLKIKHL